METIEQIEGQIKHLENILQKIEWGKRYESDFDKLYQLLKDEFHLTGGDDALHYMNSYNHNLSQTIDKQAAVYIDQKRKRPVKGAPTEYEEFISNFRMDVNSELVRWKYKLNPPVPKH